MLVVLDTNVLLSALISPHGISDFLYRAWRSGRFELVTSTVQLNEIKRASRYPKFKKILQPHRVGTMINNIQQAIVLEHLPPPIQKTEIHDPNDLFLLGMAQAKNVDYLVTGDQKSGLLQHVSVGRTKIITPVTFCNNVLQQKI